MRKPERSKQRPGRRTGVFIKSPPSTPAEAAPERKESYSNAAIHELAIDGCRMHIPETSQPPAIDEILSIRLPVGENEQWRAIPGRVTRCRKERNNSWIAEIEFEPMPPSLEQELSAFLQQLDPWRFRLQSHRYFRERWHDRTRRMIILTGAILLSIALALALAQVPRLLNKAAQSAKQSTTVRNAIHKEAVDLAKYYKEKRDRGELSREEVEELKRLKKEFLDNSR